MKTETKRNLLIAWLLSVAFAVSSIGCLTSGFRLEPEGVLGIVLCCIAVTGLSCLCFSFRYGGIIFLCVTAFLGGWLYREGSLLLEIESLLYQISLVYDRGYGWGVIRWSKEYLGDVPINGALCLASCLCAVPAAFALIRKKNLILPLTVGLIPLFACMVVTDTIPGTLWMILLIVSLLLIILPQSVRRLSQKDGQRLTAMLLLPAMLFSLILFALIPQNGYEMQLEELRQAVTGWFSSLPFVLETPDGKLFISFTGEAEDHMNLSTVGPKNQLNYAVMDVISTRTEHLYLRGQSFDTYDGTSWFASNEDELFGNWPTDGQLTPSGNITISLRSRRKYYYTPYYISDMPQLARGKMPNSKREKEYSFLRYSLKSDATHLPGRVPTEFLKLPDATKVAAEDYINRNLYVGEFANAVFETTEALATAIGKIVERSASYSLNTPRMPENETDFVMWFLEQSDTGYCVHFASAAAVLLRSQGIPARFVSGYTCQARTGRRVTVTSQQAHAWVEYYDKDLGCWRILDPTPAGSGSGSPPATSVTVPPVNTEPTVPTAPTAPTAPTETAPTLPTMTLPGPTDPTEGTTAPTQPTEDPTEPSGGIGIGPGEGPGGGSFDPAKLWEAVKPYLVALLWCLSVAAVLAGQYGIRRRYRNQRMRTGHHNRRALARWQETLRLGKLIQAEPPERLRLLAEKAKFSQHTLSAGELMEFDEWMDKAQKALRAKPWYQRLVIRLIWAV